MQQAQQNTAPQGIWGKLMQLQKAFKTFAQSEDSEKKDGKTSRSAYRYAPGWEITEKIREQMDALGLMLVPDCRFKQIDLIEYPVYKIIGSNPNPMSFTKKEMHVAIEADFTWVDTATGEKEGPFHIVASGANGTDKSTASALALAERYFFLKFFHITTHEPSDEPDAHDSDSVPGIPKNIQKTVTDGQACTAVPGGAPQYRPAPVAQGGYPQYGAPAGPAPQAYGQRPLPVAPAAPQGGQQVNVFTGAPQYVQGASTGAPPFNENIPLIRQMVERLMQFESGTETHRQVLNESIGILSSNGIICTDKNFVENFVEAAQARRENRSPRYV